MEKVRFKSRQGSMLTGVLHLPQRPARTGIVLTHGFRGTKEGGGKAVELAGELSRRGYLVFRFDFTGAGESEGDFSDITLTRQVADLLGALDWLEKRYDLPLLAVGRSFGGSTALATAANDCRLRGLCLWSTPLDMVDTFRRSLKDLYDCLMEGRDVSITDDNGAVFRLKPEFVRDLEGSDLYRDLCLVAGRPILFLHGANDQTVCLGQVTKGYQEASSPKKMVVIPGGDHQFTHTWGQAWEALFEWLEEIGPLIDQPYP